jgi:hypothetical protein
LSNSSRVGKEEKDIGVLNGMAEDLDRARTARLEDGELRIAMAASEGIMFFEKKTDEYFPIIHCSESYERK